MGVDFRGGSYVKRVRLGKRTVKDGEAVAVWDRAGKHSKIVGPRLVYLFYSTIRFLDQYVASAQQYLVLEHPSGAIEHRRGPCAEFHDPVEFRSIRVRDAVLVPTANQCIVVLDTSSEGKPRIEQGSYMFFPKPSESVHAFHWSDFKGNRSEMRDFSVLNLKSSFIFALPTADHAEAIFNINYVVTDAIRLAESNADLATQIRDRMTADLITVTCQQLQRICFGPEQSLPRGSSSDDIDLPNKSTEIVSMTGAFNLFPSFAGTRDSVGIEVVSVAVLSTSPSLETRRLAEAKSRSLIDLQVAEENAQAKLRVSQIELQGEVAAAETRHAFEKQKLKQKLALKTTEAKMELESRAAAAEGRHAFETKQVELKASLKQLEDRLEFETQVAAAKARRVHEEEDAVHKLRLREIEYNALRTLKSARMHDGLEYFSKFQGMGIDVGQLMTEVVRATAVQNRDAPDRKDALATFSQALLELVAEGVNQGRAE